MSPIPQKFECICQRELPDYSAWFPETGLPGTRPVDAGDWLLVDDVYAGQMAFRDWLISNRRPSVIAQVSGAGAAMAELLDLVLSETVSSDGFRHVDGAAIDVDRDDPLATLGRLAQEDFCILQKQGREHVLTAAVLCFPSSWSLVEKLGRPLVDIHAPVDSYTSQMGARVQRLFDAIRPDVVLCRTNLLRYSDPCLHQIRTEANRRNPDDDTSYPFVRVERQTLRKLPETGAVVFGIHSYVVRDTNIPIA